MSPGKCLSGLDTLAVTSHAHNVVTNQKLIWARMWPMRELGDRVSGLDEFLGDWWEHWGMRCYKVRPRMLPLSSDGCWLCHFWPIRAQRLLTLANQQPVLSSNLHLRLLHRLQERVDCSEDVTNNMALRSVHCALKGSTESHWIVWYLDFWHLEFLETIWIDFK